MHKFLRAIGFSDCETREEMLKLVENSVKEAEEKNYTSYRDNILYAEYFKEYGDNIGLCIRGEYNEENVFQYDYCFPYLKGFDVSSEEDVTIERQAEKESYAGVCDDSRVGITLIFYLQNVVNYMKFRNAGKLPCPGTALALTALSVSGTIMMPIKKNEAEMQSIREISSNRTKLISKAKNGDEEAIESLTLEDMDTYTTISRKIRKEDIYSIVDTSFMPYGVECDQYSVLAEILDSRDLCNHASGEFLVWMKLSCNDIVFDVCINRQDLYGEPKIGRRFRGVVWLQGKVIFESCT